MINLLSVPSDVRLAPSLYISYSTKSDIHGIIMNPSDGWGSYCLMKYFCQHQILEKVIQSSSDTEDKMTRGSSTVLLVSSLNMSGILLSCPI